MNGGSHNIAVLADHAQVGQPSAPRDEAAAVGYAALYDEDGGYDAPTPGKAGLVIGSLTVIAALAWTGAFIYALLPLWQQQVPPPEAMLSQFVIFCVPVLLLVTLYALATRNGRIQSRQALTAVARLRAEQERLDAALTRVARRIGDETAALTETHDSLMALGEDATQRMKAASDAMQDEVATLTRYGNALKFSATSARADIAVLLSDLPKAQLETRQMVSALQEAGATAHDHATALDTMMSTLGDHGREADRVAGTAAEKLAAHLTQIESVGDVAGGRLSDAAERMTAAFDTALGKAAEASDAARQTMDAQAEAMRALVDQAQVSLQRTGAQAGDTVGRHVDDITTRIEALGALLDGQTRTTADLVESVRTNIAGLDSQFVALDTGGSERAERLSAALARLDAQAASLSNILDTGAARADTMIARTDHLMTALDATTREIDETLPAAFARLEDHASRAHATVSATSPVVAQLAADSSSALERLAEAEAIMAKHRAALDAIADSATARVATTQQAATDLIATVENADATARALADGAGAQLIEAMVRVREAAQVASERAREAITAAIPDSTARLSASVREALTSAVTEQVTAHLADLSQSAEHAVAAATRASDTLMRHMLTISETSAAVEARITEARTDIEANDRDNFARRVALLIESLNSTSIDVTKLLASDITDTSWAAYLRGDRGIFTRRAVRLLDGSEARAVLRHYETDPEFREQVNRYVHDYEAMLRNVLATRDGSSLGVALLSSDMGKLYVALAQAIERLRA